MLDTLSKTAHVMLPIHDSLTALPVLRPPAVPVKADTLSTMSVLARFVTVNIHIVQHVIRPFAQIVKAATFWKTTHAMFAIRDF